MQLSIFLTLALVAPYSFATVIPESKIDWSCTIKCPGDCCITNGNYKCCYPNRRGSDGYCYQGKSMQSAKSKMEMPESKIDCSCTIKYPGDC